MTDMNWMDVMRWFTSNTYHPLIAIVLAQNDGEPMDELNLAGRAAIMNQQMTGEVIETAVVVKHIMDLAEKGFLERAPDGFRWQLTDLGLLVSRQWAPGNVEPAEQGPLDHDAVRGWRNRVIEMMDSDAELAKKVGIDQQEWMMTQSQRMVELHVLNRILGEDALPNWLVRMRSDPDAAEVTEE